MDKRKEKNPLGWIFPLIFLVVTNPGMLVLVVPMAVFGGIIWLVIRAVAKSQGTASASSARYTTRQEKYDNCSQPVFCRHTDKSEHHVRRGKEIDPWDRPDIDIRKYQRNR